MDSLTKEKLMATMILQGLVTNLSNIENREITGIEIGFLVDNAKKLAKTLNDSFNPEFKYCRAKNNKSKT